MDHIPLLKSETHFILRVLDKEQLACYRSKISDLKGNMWEGRRNRLITFYKKCLDQIGSLAEHFKLLTVKQTKISLEPGSSSVSTT